jgi:hypothetical protein
VAVPLTGQPLVPDSAYNTRAAAGAAVHTSDRRHDVQPRQGQHPVVDDPAGKASSSAPSWSDLGERGPVRLARRRAQGARAGVRGHPARRQHARRHQRSRPPS